MSPARHEFTYRLFMMYLDLDELDTVFHKRWLWSTKRRAIARFRREDHLGDRTVPLKEAVCELVKEKTGHAPTGPIRLLTHLGYFGYCFNPVSFYYCFDRKGEKVETIVAEVNNTPWGEQHCYVLGEQQNEGKIMHKRYRPVKSMHVSPFMPMDIDYDWRFSLPRERLCIYMANARSGEKIFDATLDFKRSDISMGSLARVLLTFPMMTAKVILAIHWQALKLWLKRVPVYDHADSKKAITRNEI